MPTKWISILLLLQLSCHFSPGCCGKVLVWPTEYSHWMNMKTILDELVQRGHEVTVLTSSASILVDPSKASPIKFEIFPASLTKDDFEDVIMQLISKWTYTPKDTFWTYFSLTQNMILEYSDYIRKLCKDAVLNKKLMTKLQESRFDVVLADAVGPCGELLAELLKRPLVYSLRAFPGYKIEKYTGGLPFPPSYVPVVLSELSDQMTFMERVKNMIYVLYFDFWFQAFSEKWDQFYSEVLGRPTTLFELMSKAEIWFIRSYWDFEFPRPLLPHFEFVGGLHCKPAKPLPKCLCGSFGIQHHMPGDLRRVLPTCSSVSRVLNWERSNWQEEADQESGIQDYQRALKRQGSARLHLYSIRKPDHKPGRKPPLQTLPAGLRAQQQLHSEPYSRPLWTAQCTSCLGQQREQNLIEG